MAANLFHIVTKTATIKGLDIESSVLHFFFVITKKKKNYDSYFLFSFSVCTNYHLQTTRFPSAVKLQVPDHFSAAKWLQLTKIWMIVATVISNRVLLVTSKNSVPSLFLKPPQTKKRWLGVKISGKLSVSLDSSFIIRRGKMLGPTPL